MRHTRSLRAMFGRPRGYVPPPALQTTGPRFALPGQAYAPNPNRAALRGAAAVDRLAQDMRDLAAAHGGAVDKDLETLGWPKAAIAANAEAARILAQQLSVREVA